MQEPQKTQEPPEPQAPKDPVLERYEDALQKVVTAAQGLDVPGSRVEDWKAIFGHIETLSRNSPKDAGRICLEVIRGLANDQPQYTQLWAQFNNLVNMVPRPEGDEIVLHMLVDALNEPVLEHMAPEFIALHQIPEEQVKRNIQNYINFATDFSGMQEEGSIDRADLTHSLADILKNPRIETLREADKLWDLYHDNIYRLLHPDPNERSAPTKEIMQANRKVAQKDMDDLHKALVHADPEGHLSDLLGIARENDITLKPLPEATPLKPLIPSAQPAAPSTETAAWDGSVTHGLTSFVQGGGGRGR